MGLSFCGQQYALYLPLARRTEFHGRYRDRA